MKNQFQFPPFLDMIPAEPDTMKTAMVEAQRLTLLTGQEWTIFTNDQQLYQVAVNITWVDQSMHVLYVCSPSWWNAHDDGFCWNCWYLDARK